MNILSILLDKAAAERKFGYHPKCKNLQLTHLCFGDDLIIFADGKLRSMEGIMSVFDNFAIMCGLKIIIEKSTLFMGGVSAEMRSSIATQFPFASGILPVRYLGLPLLTKRMTKLDYAPLVEKIRSKIISWTSRFWQSAAHLLCFNKHHEFLVINIQVA